MVCDVRNPAAPEFVRSNRDFDGSEIGPDSGPEIVRFADAKGSPSGKPMLVIANEITDTVNLFELKP